MTADPTQTQTVTKVTTKKKKKKKKKKKSEATTDTLKLSYECNAKPEKIWRIFGAKDEQFLKGIFRGQFNQNKSNTEFTEYVIGDNSFKYTIITDQHTTKQETEDEDEEEEEEEDVYYLQIKFMKKEWHENDCSIITMQMSGDEDTDGLCYLEFEQKLIPKDDQYGNPDQLSYMKNFWERTIFRDGLTKLWLIPCNKQ